MAKKRIVAYIRVSTASKAQLHSYEFQSEYWNGKFEGDPDNELVAIYADKGISGSSVGKRPQFLAMMEDARQHKFDAIHTKSVSRFARNTVQLLEAVRELRDLGIEVVFEKENISTMQATSEVFLTIAATIAENDLVVDSERQRWSIQHRFANGWISIGNGMYGYRMVEGNTLEIIPHEAEIVRRIYAMYIDGAGSKKIADTLTAEGVPSYAGGEWSGQRILDMISNEKYMGDSLMGKKVKVLGVEYRNRDGKYGDRYYTEDTHEGIVSKETWYKAQEIRQQRKNMKLVGRAPSVHAFTGLVECGQCGAHFNHKVNNCGKKWQSDIWCCATSLKGGVAACDCTRIKDTVLKEKFIEAYNEFVTTRPTGDTIATLQSVIDGLAAEERGLAELRMQRLIPENTFRDEQRRIKGRIVELQERIGEIRGSAVTESDHRTITEFDETIMKKFITKVIVRKGTVTFVFYNGARITREYTNGQAGNKVGWNKKEAV